MLNVRIEIQDNDDILTRNKDFEEDSSWQDIIIATAELIGAKYGYDITHKIRFIGYSSPFDNFQEYMIDPEDWQKFVDTQGLKIWKQENLFDEED